MDKRLIDKILSYENDRLLKLEAFTFSNKNTPNKREIGLIAQEVAAIEPLLVNQTPQGYLVIDYTKFSVALFDLVKQQSKQIEDLQREILTLKNKKKSGANS